MAPTFDIDFLPVGDGKDSGDAIAMQFVRRDNGEWARVIIDAGFGGDGDDLVEHVKSYYGTDAIDLAILTHPDGDHIGGMGEVLRGLSVSELWVHNIGSHGGATLPAAGAVNELISVAREQGTLVTEPWAGEQCFGGAFTLLGPDESYYDQLVIEQVEGVTALEEAKKAVVAVGRGLWDRVAGWLGDEVPFPEKEVSPRNNAAMITLLKLEDKTLLFTADAGVPALERAWDLAESLGLADAPTFVQVPHHGSRRNASSAWLDRLLGSTGQDQVRSAFISVVSGSPKHPSGKVVNAYTRRGCAVHPTAGDTKWHHSNGRVRPGFSPATPLGPMIEEDDD